MDITTIFLIGIVLILLLLVVFLMMSKITSTPDAQKKKVARKHICKDCLFCKEGGCCYFHDDTIDVERPACVHYEQKEEYRPA